MIHPIIYHLYFMMSELTKLEGTQFDDLRLRLEECVHDMNRIISSRNEGWVFRCGLLNSY